MTSEMTSEQCHGSQAVTQVLRECFHGAQDQGSFLDPGPNGLLALLWSVPASEASAPVAGSSMATHALHLAFSLDAFLDWIQGIRDVEYDWSESWKKSMVDDQEWADLLARLERQHLELERAIGLHAPRDTAAMWGAAGVLAHTAYHLGMLQLKLDALLQDHG